MRTTGLVMGMVMLVAATFTVSWGGAAREEAVSLVQAAAAYYRANGFEKSIDEFSRAAGPFNKGELYIFVYDTNATMLAHPNPRLIGQNMLDLPDAEGKKFRKEIVTTALKDGKGWTDYKYQNPKTKELADKTTYYEKVEDVIICCGVYK
jgi:signal transduction histidine kinase